MVGVNNVPGGQFYAHTYLVLLSFQLEVFMNVTMIQHPKNQHDQGRFICSGLCAYDVKEDLFYNDVFLQSYLHF